MLDARAKAEYRQRLRALRDELEDAEELGDAERLARARAEREAIAAHAVGRGGRDRRTGAAADRARCTVTHGIRRALQHIRPARPTLADELRLRIRTGVYCVYVPDVTHPTDWVV